MQVPVLHPKEFIHILRTQQPFAHDPVLRAAPVIGMDASRLPASRKKFIREWGVDDVVPRLMKMKVLRDVLLYWSRREMVPNQGGCPGGQGYRIQPVWGPFPLTGYTGPRSLL